MLNDFIKYLRVVCGKYVIYKIGTTLCRSALLTNNSIIIVK